MEETTKQVKTTPNPTGVGGFSSHPENRNNGGRYPRSESFVYWLNYFKGLSIKDFNEWEGNNPEETRSVASDLVYRRIKNAKENLRDFQEVANRSEGKSKESVEYSGEVGVSYEETLEILEKVDKRQEEQNNQILEEALRLIREREGREQTIPEADLIHSAYVDAKSEMREKDYQTARNEEIARNKG